MDIHTLEVQQKNISYLHARDPSILAWNRGGLADIRINLEDELAEVTEEKPHQQDDNHVQVYLRIKGGVPFESLYNIQNGTTLICRIPEGSHALRNAKEGELVTKKYSFSKIFAPEATQIDIFNHIVKPKMLDFINGNNCTLLTYGASGSGKTFTIVGTSDEPGLIPRALEYLFRTIPQLSETPTVKPLSNGKVIKLNGAACREERQARENLLNASATMLDRAHIRTYKAMQQRLSEEPAAILDDVQDISLAVWVSFTEIYNEHIYDLLQPDPARGKQRPKLRLGSSNGNTYVKNLSTVSVTSGLEAFQILQYGIHNLNYAATTINSHSSRSHSIFTIRLAQASNIDDGIGVSHFNFCDLAGSERLKKTMNVGDRLRESNNINTSLLVLGRCIKGVRNAQKQNDQRLVPFRESKLTQLFQKALSGMESISMIVNMNPSQEMFDESHHVLNFSAIAKDITVEHEPKTIIKPPKHNRFSHYMENRQRHLTPMKEEYDEDLETLRALVNQLQTELEQQKADYELNQEVQINELVSGYREMMKAAQDNYQQMLEATKRRCKAEYEMKLNTLRDHYECLLEENAKRPKIINLDDSDEEDVEELQKKVEQNKKLIREQQQLISSLQQELTSVGFNTKVESSKLQEKIRVLTAEKQSLKTQVVELQKTLEDAVASYKDLEESAEIEKAKFKELLGQRLELTERVAELEEQLSQRIALENDLLHEEDDDGSSGVSSQDSKAHPNCGLGGLSYLCDRTNLTENKGKLSSHVNGQGSFTESKGKLTSYLCVQTNIAENKEMLSSYLCDQANVTQNEEKLLSYSCDQNVTSSSKLTSNLCDHTSITEKQEMPSSSLCVQTKNTENKENFSEHGFDTQATAL